MSTPDSTGFYSYTETLKGVFYGPGITKDALPKLLKSLNVKKGLIVTGTSLATKTDVIKKVEAILAEHGAHAGTLSSIQAHVPVSGIIAGIKQFRESGADFIVSIGGGSPIDASKSIRFRMWQEDKTDLPVPQIAIPTTLAAAEYTSGGGYINEEGAKVGHSAPTLAPAGVILDAELTLPTPERLWLSTGIRAVDHAVESLYRDKLAPPIKYLCWGALADFFKYLPISKKNPNDVIARHNLLMAAWASLWPFKQEAFTPYGLSHTLGHKLGGRYSIGHGITSCITLAPIVGLQNILATDEHKENLSVALIYLGQPRSGDTDKDIATLSGLIDNLIKSLDLTSTLPSNKVPQSDVPGIVESVMGKDNKNLQLVIDTLNKQY